MGFDVEAVMANSEDYGIGIRNVRKRLRLLCQGTLEISSTIGEGTTVIIKIPED